MQQIFITISLSILLLISGCSTSHFPWVYRINVEQGNVLDEDKVEQLKVGMTQRQVRYLLGTPMIQDTFNQNRWDYMYSYQSGKGKLTRERITLTFNGEVLSNIEKKEYDDIQLKY